MPVGDGDAYFRALSQRRPRTHPGEYPVAGRVCIDQIMVNIEWDTAYNDDPVVLLGEDGDEVITCEHLANWAGTIHYDILTNINTRVPLVYV